MKNQVLEEVYRLTSGLCEKRLSDAELERLQQLVSSDQAARLAYLEYISLHAELHRAAGFPSGDEPRLPADAPTARLPLHEPVWVGPSQSWHVLPWWSRRLSDGRLLLCFAAAVGVLAACLLALTLWPGPGARQAAEQPERPPGDVVARVTDQVDAQWESAAGLGQLAAGRRLRLHAGASEIGFRSGATGVLQGPAQLALEGTSRVRLERGKLVVHVPPQAAGFTVEVPGAEIVDFGTEFGVQVDQEGVSLVHVFQGEVELGRIVVYQGTSPPQDSLSVRLVEGESAAILRGVVKPVKVNAGAFLRDLQTLAGRTKAVDPDELDEEPPN